jgi:hypothetical protein
MACALLLASRMQQGVRRSEPLATSQRDFIIRLVRGSTRQAASWILQAGPGGTALTIGSGLRCEWRIRAAGVPAHALSLMLTEHGLYACAAGEGIVRIDGRPLSNEWSPVPGGARIDVGMAGLVVSNAEALELEPIDPEQSGVRLTPAPEPAPRRSSLWRFSRYSLPDAPSVLGRYTPSADKFWLYVVSGLALAGYGVWVALLE